MSVCARPPTYVLVTWLLLAAAHSTRAQSFPTPTQPAEWGTPPLFTQDPLAAPIRPWTWQLLPDDLLYRSYQAGPREPRLASAWLHESDDGWLWDFTIGARVGLLRYGSHPGQPPSGWQLDLHGAAFPRLNMEHNYDLDAVDFQAGIPLTWRDGPWQGKIEYRHVSAHLGDEFLIRNIGFPRVNYVRDSLVFGGGYWVTPDTLLYLEADYAFVTDGGAEPWHFRFGIDYSPQPVVEWLGWHGMPFFGVNGELREEADFGGAVNAMAGWQLRGPQSDRILRFGLQIYDGRSRQFSFFNQHEQLIGLGLWYDY